MRFIVGADLDIDDVRAILAGEYERLTAKLGAELDAAASWPPTVTRGVELLAWMVKHGYLEIRVALRVHISTGEPLPADSSEDGYVHMKWAIFEDSESNRLYVSGSLNESRTALVKNAENIDVHCSWHGETERRRANEAQAEFNALWENRHEAFRVLSLPQALREKLISLAPNGQPLEIDGTSALPINVPAPSALELLTFSLIKDAPRLPGGKYLGMETAPIEPWPHQRIVARRLIDTWPYSYLLCDEVGLGKTIETGLALRSLYLSGFVKRALIAPPAHVAPQWQREMAEKFFLPFALALGGAGARHKYLLPVEREVVSDSLYAPSLNIVSTGLLARKERREDLQTAADFDVVLLDEAHYARRANATEGTRGSPEYNNLFKLTEKVLRPKARSLLLATATPMQLDPVEAADLMRLTRRAGPFLCDPATLLCYYGLLAKLREANRLDQAEWEFLWKAVMTAKAHDPAQWDFISRTVIQGRFKRDIERWLQNPETNLPPLGLQGVRRLLFAAAPLSRTMLRHTRALLEEYRRRGQLTARLARRTILRVPEIRFTSQEQEVYERFEPYCKELGRRIAQTSHNRAAIGFLLSFLRLRFASSLYAIKRTLERRYERVQRALELAAPELDERDEDEIREAFLEESEEDDVFVSAMLKQGTRDDLNWELRELKQLLAAVSDLSRRPSKVDALLRVLDDRRKGKDGRVKQTVIFTRFYDTLTDLAERLLAAEPRMRLGCFSGPGCRYRSVDLITWQTTRREDIKRRFLRGEIDVLLCTDAAAEGLNLQTADLLVNFDLPWNPMKVEQRVGRIDRIGQRHEEIFVLNLCYPGSAEEIVYGRLLERLRGVIDVVGTQQLTLLPVTPEEFAKLANGELSQGELEAQVRARLEATRRRNANMEMPATELYEIYGRLSDGIGQTPVPATLERIFKALVSSTSLQALGCELKTFPEGKALALKNMSGVPNGALLTTSRELYEKGIAGFEGRLHFASWGDAAFDAVLSAVIAHELPGCIKRLEATVPGTAATLICYAVATSDGVRLVKSLAELEVLAIADRDVIPPETLDVLRGQIVSLARETGRHIELAHWAEQINQRAGEAQAALQLFAAASLLDDGVSAKEGTFRSQLAELETRLLPRLSIRVRRIPRQPFEGDGLLFDTTPVSTSDTCYIDVAQFFLPVLMDTARREAAAMKVAGAQLTTTQVIQRLYREAQGRIQRE